MHLSTPQAQNLSDKTHKIFTAFEHLSKNIQDEMQHKAVGYSDLEKEMITRMILNLIKGCKTKSEIEAVLAGTSPKTDLVEQMDNVAVTGSIYLIEELSLKYVSALPRMDDFEFLSDEQLEQLVQTIAHNGAGVQITGDLERAQGEEAATPSMTAARKVGALKTVGQKATVQDDVAQKDVRQNDAPQKTPREIDGTMMKDDVQEAAFLNLSPFQTPVMNDWDGLTVSTALYPCYPMTRGQMLSDAMKEIYFHQQEAFEKKYGSLTPAQRLRLCEVSEELVDVLKTPQDTRLFFVRPLSQKEKILPGFKELSHHERSFVKDAVAHYFDYRDRHPGAVATVCRKVGGWIGKSFNARRPGILHERGQNTRG